MPNLEDWIWPGTIGACAAAVILLILRGATGPAGLRWSAAAVAAAFVAACFKLNLIQRFPPIQREQWLAYLAIPLAIFGTMDACWKPWPLVRWLFAILICLGMAILLFHPFRLTVWAEQDARMWFGLIALAMLAAWGSADQLERHSSVSLVILAATALATALVAALSGYVTMGPVAVALAGACGASLIVQLIGWPDGPARGVAIVAAPLLVAILFITLVAAALTRLNLCLLLLAFFLPHILMPLARRRPKLGAVLQIVIALIPLAVAVLLAKRDFDAAARELGM